MRAIVIFASPFVVFAGCVLASGCSKREAPPAVIASDASIASAAPAERAAAIAPHAIPRPENAVAELAVLTGAPRTELDALLAPARRRALLSDRFCGDAAACEAVRAFASDAKHVEVRVEKASDWGIPKGEALAYVAAGLGADERDAIPKLPWAIVVTARGPALPSALPMRAAFALTAALAERLHAVVYDEVLRRIESHAAFAAHAITAPLDAPAFREDRIVIQLYRQDDGTARLLTLGMRRFGAPDVEIEGARTSAGTPLGRALNLIAERLANGEAQAPMRLGKSEATAIDLAPSPRHEGDPDNTFLRVIAPGGSDAKAYDDLVTALEGAPHDEALEDHEGAELTAATARARASFGAAVERWRRSRAGADADGGANAITLTVKLPFPYGDASHESMWLDVTRVSREASANGSANGSADGSDRGALLEGTLANVPVYATGLTRGGPASGREGDLLDYILTLPDGGTEGGETARILSRVRGMR